ncbi:hypothetical protein IWQ60_005205 [Tieghemiomyces parasiticus]|uniref:Phosphatidate phosphatase APP1 catalytic domain-containing protein n=1 Tax=Tieghemiomyces parasiticus TaxID=78921 RepID=A0A9W8A6Q4_9FUNG|nr:hypothetical protein IWQ60_005205 [Tieghemiomyces parasiticus]
MQSDTNLLLFPTYATKEKDGWRVRTKGWTYTTNSNSRKVRVALALARKMTGSGAEEEARSMFTDRFSMLMADTMRNTTVSVRVAGLTVPTHMVIEGDPVEPNPGPNTSAYNATMANAQPNGSSAASLTSARPPSHTAPPLPRRTSELPRQGSDSVRVYAENGRFSSYLQVSNRDVMHWLGEASPETKDAAMRGHMLLRLEGFLYHNSTPSFGVADLISPYGTSVISDIDDTIKISNVTGGKLALMQNTLFQRSQQVPGMAALYRSWWEQGVHFHYVSNSPWQLLPTLQKFFRENNFPPGSAHLKMWDTGEGGSRFSFLQSPADGKRDAIRGILADFPYRKFIFVGDSGQMDMELYADIAREFPNQVVKIFIRDITSPDPHVPDTKSDSDSCTPPTRAETERSPLGTPGYAGSSPIKKPILRTSLSEGDQPFHHSDPDLLAVSAAAKSLPVSNPSSPGSSFTLSSSASSQHSGSPPLSRASSGYESDSVVLAPSTRTVTGGAEVENLSRRALANQLSAIGSRPDGATKPQNDRPRAGAESTPKITNHPHPNPPPYEPHHPFAPSSVTLTTPSAHAPSSWLPRNVSQSSLRKMVSKMSLRNLAGSVGGGSGGGASHPPDPHGQSIYGTPRGITASTPSQRNGPHDYPTGGGGGGGGNGTRPEQISDNILYDTAASREAVALMEFYDRVDRVFSHLRDDQWELFQGADRVRDCPVVAQYLGSRQRK